MTDELRIEYIPLSKLKKYARNSKDHDLGLLHDSIGRFGFLDPMAIDEGSGELVEGHGRLEDLETRQLDGLARPKHIMVVDGEWAPPVIRGITFSDDMERRAYTIAHNRTTEMGGWHEELLLPELRTLAEMDVPFEGIGYDLDDLDRMIADEEFRAAVPEPAPTIAAAANLSARFGARVDAKSIDDENTLVELLAAHGYEAKRLSE